MMLCIQFIKHGYINKTIFYVKFGSFISQDPNMNKKNLHYF